MITVPFMVEPRDQSTLVDSLTGDDFWNHFRITRPTFAKLCCSLNELVNKKGEQAIRCPIDVKIATTLEVLAGITRSSVGFKAAEVALIFTEVLAALAEWSATMVQWPDERERKRISQNFFELTGLKNVVGCIDGTIIRGTQGLNVGVVADDRKRFRWVFAKFHSNEDDDSVFKQSLLCQQLRDGRRKGILIGDDAYKSESFLLTPEGKDWMTEEDFALANTVRRAHLMVQEAITAWKRQFPILNGTIRSARIARIVVCCAALYNLSRVENEPVFEGEDEIVIDDTEEQCLTISE
ncbi:DDE Tnp4 domain-containing protein [Trichostrongylus colubriformis]|uniref:DDE Tnp4 domain-containing protein n=1 Tax=Trichostrongylus colubriformis TaxID=6319 RepID=A0AAN8EYH6_TRICO